jgi:glucose/arabinose dehydrogenase/cytochrome c553
MRATYLQCLGAIGSRRFVMLLAVLASFSSGAQTPQADYAQYCASCHGVKFTASPVNSVGDGDEALADAIRKGNAERGMPAFGAQLSKARIAALAQLIKAHRSGTNAAIGKPIVAAESLDAMRSSGYVIMREGQSERPLVGYFGEGSNVCYANLDLTGVRSIEMTYALGGDEPGRVAVFVGDGASKATLNAGEHTTKPTGAWDKLARRSMGLERELNGPHELCFYGVRGGGIFNLDSFVLSTRAANNDGITLRIDDEPLPAFNAAGYRIALEKFAEASTELWGIAFRPDGSMLATQKNGQLLVFDREGEFIGAVVGLPRVWNGAQGGLLDVKLHPQYARNGWIYLTFSDPSADSTASMTRVVRGKLDGLRWVDQQDIYRAPNEFYSADYAHFGSRIAFADGYLYFSIGDRQQPQHVQSLAHPNGKIHRLHDDGRIPKDNPFVGRADALPSVWSYGHRNPQGMARDPESGAIWAAEHGPAGGDEVNLVRAALNYGWPLVSHGKHYDGTPVSDSPYRDGVEPPRHHFTPSIGISQLAFYTGSEFPEWRGKLLVASLGKQQLYLLDRRGAEIVDRTLLLEGVGRIRDVVNGPDGHLYIILNRFKPGVYRVRRAPVT